MKEYVEEVAESGTDSNKPSVLLIDDVLTTGTTARRCAAALREGGAEDITVLAFTRAVGSK